MSDAEVPVRRKPGRPPKAPVEAKYRVVRNVEHPILEATLNGMAEQGWRFHSLSPAIGGYLCVFER